MAPRPPTSLTDGVVELRPLHEADRAAVLETMRDPLVRRWLNMPERPVDADFDALLRAASLDPPAGSRIDLVVVELATAIRAGSVIASRRQRENWEVAYMSHPAGRGRGLLTRAVRLLCDWLFVQGVGRLELRTHTGNEASQRLAERAGFRREGRERQSIWVHGQRADAFAWSLLPGDSR